METKYKKGLRLYDGMDNHIDTVWICKGFYKSSSRSEILKHCIDQYQKDHRSRIVSFTG